MLTRPQLYEAEAKTHEAETYKAEAKFTRLRFEKPKNLYGSLVKR